MIVTRAQQIGYPLFYPLAIDLNVYDIASSYYIYVLRQPLLLLLQGLKLPRVILLCNKLSYNNCMSIASIGHIHTLIML